MKSLRIILILILLALASEALAITHFSDTAISGAGTRSLKSCATMTDGDRSTVTTADGIMFFEFDAASTATENLTTHPYIVQPTTGSGRWVERSPALPHRLAPYFVDVSEMLTVLMNIDEEARPYPVMEVVDSNGRLSAAIAVTLHSLNPSTAAGQIELMVPMEGSLTTHTQKAYVPLADTEKFSLEAARPGLGSVQLGEEWAIFRVSSAGAVTIIHESANVTTTNGTDANLNIYDNGDHAVIENQLGISLICTIDFTYGG